MAPATKTRKVLDIAEFGYRMVCIKDLTGKTNTPYKLYHEWWVPGKGKRRLLVGKHAEFESVLTDVKSLFIEGYLTK